MKSFNKASLLLMLIILCNAPALMSGVSQDVSDIEIKQIMAAAKRYYDSFFPPSTAPIEAKFNFVFRKKVENCALVWLVPKPKYAHQEEGEAIILRKIGGNWVVQFAGTDPQSIEEACPELNK